MSVRFKGSELRPVLAEAIANKCRIVLVKDDEGAYLSPERGAGSPDRRPTTIAYVVGCNPAIHPFADWWDLAHAEFGREDFCEFFHPNEPVLAHILQSEDDLEVSPRAIHQSLRAVPPAPTGH